MHRRIGASVIGLALVVVLATGGAVAFAAQGPQASTAQQSEGPSVSISNQTSGGTTVTVDSVTLPEGGFVTIHDATVTKGGSKVFSSVRGTSAYLSAGTHENVTVHLDEPVEDTGTLVAMAHRDTNGDHTYSFVASNGEADGPYTANGGAVIDTAKVTVSATVTYTQSQSEGTYAVVERVELSENGFVTIHDSSLLDGATFKSVRGSSDQLSAGVHENVRVKLDEPLQNDDTLIAMPHKDTNNNGEYDFVTSDGQEDGPFTNKDGDIVLSASQVELVDDSSASVSIKKQATGGNLVYVESAFLPSGGFVTIHDSSLAEGEVFASVRGSSAYLKPGHHSHVPVKLDKQLKKSDTLIAMPHFDTNNNKQYDFVSSDGQEDGPYTDGDGDIVTDSAKATVSAGVHVHAQASAGDSITVASVDLSKNGFVTIHDASLTAGATFDSVRGSKFLKAGLHENVKVALDDPLKTSQTVYAMPHKDTNGNQQYDFVSSNGGADGPFTANGNIVLDPARTTVLSQVTFEDQQTKGKTVVVKSVTMQDGGFVTIHGPSLADGKALASVKGTSKYLGPGTHTNVKITFSEKVTKDGTYFAMPHYDTNNNKQYDFVSSKGKADGPYTAGGNIVLAPAKLDLPATASVTFEAQTTSGSSVTVKSATLSEGGFVTIHDSTLVDGKTFESVRGSSAYLKPGTHENVKISLDDPIKKKGKFFAMPHKDTNDNKQYDFVSSNGQEDGPYTKSGDIVLDPATVSVSGMSDETSTDETPTEAEGTETPGQPGFGFAVSVVALAGAALLASRRDA